MVYLRSCKNCRNNTFCTVCLRNDHSHEFCPEVWRKYCSTTTAQQVRKVPGPVYKPAEQQWCCVCAKKGHFPENCQPLFVEPITFRNGNGFHTPVHTPKVKRKKKKFYSEFRKKKVHSRFEMPC